MTPMLRLATLVPLLAMGATTADPRPTRVSGPDPSARLTIARLQYDGGGDWYANPSSLPNLLQAIAQRTSLRVERT